MEIGKEIIYWRNFAVKKQKKFKINTNTKLQELPEIKGYIARNVNAFFFSKKINKIKCVYLNILNIILM